MAPNLNARLVGDASIYKPRLDKELLRDPNEGVDYFNHAWRLHFVKGVEAVFIFRFFQLQRFYRMSQDLPRWIGRLQVLRTRILDAWTDTFQADPAENLDFLVALPAEYVQLQAGGLAPQQQAVMAGLQFAPIVFVVVEAGLLQDESVREM